MRKDLKRIKKYDIIIGVRFDGKKHSLLSNSYRVAGQFLFLITNNTDQCRSNLFVGKLSTHLQDSQQGIHLPQRGWSELLH